MKKEAKKQGFTIIEVVLVLAIAGLIFLMVFVALPTLQRSQRDMQRRDDLARVATAITQFQSNNNGSVPGQKSNADVVSADFSTNNCKNNSANVATKFLCQYLNSSQAVSSGKNEFVDPDGSEYKIVIKKAGDTTVPTEVDHKIYISTQTHCEGETATKGGNDNARDYSIVYKLEGTGIYCADNK